MDYSKNCSGLSDKRILQGQKIAIEQNPIRMIKAELLTIKTKAAELIPFKVNSIQERILDLILDLLRAGKPIRMWILKARQMGVTTLLEAILYAYTSQRENINACVIADDIDGSNYIFDMQKLFQEKLEEDRAYLAPKLEHSNEKKMSYEDMHSQTLIDSSANENAGRKYTFRIVHLSEFAFFQRNPKNLMLGLSQAVPDLPGTMIFGETTANGLGGCFYELWNEAVKLTKKDATDWLPLFLPWFLMEEYHRPLTKELYPIDGIVFANTEEKREFLNEEKRMQSEGIEYEFPTVEEGEIVWKRETYALDTEQINWRRHTIVNECNGDPMKFMQEYPSTSREAFVATGDIYFDRRGLSKQQAKKKKIVGNLVEEDGKIRFRPDPYGRFTFYEAPKHQRQYVVGADPAEGIIREDGTEGDKCASVVLDKLTNRTVAAYNHLIDPDTFAFDLIKLGRYYHEAMIACENKSYGTEVNRILYRNYGNVYRRKKEKKGYIETTDEIGFNTNTVTRPQILAQLNAEIREGATDLVDEDLIAQCWTFIKNPKKNGRAEAMQGENDDLIFSRAIAGKVRQLKPYTAVDKGRTGIGEIQHTKQNAGISF